MKIIGFPIDVSQLQDDRIVKGLRTRRSLVQTTLDLIRAGDFEPSSVAIATIAGVSTRTMFQQFPSLADLYAATFEFAVDRVVGHVRPVDGAASLPNRIDLLVADRAALFEEWLPVWHFAERVRSIVPAIGSGIAQLRKLLRDRLAAWFGNELRSLDTASRDLAIDLLDRAFGLDSWMNLRKQMRLSPVHASRTWRSTVEAVVQRALAAPSRSIAVA
jgi:AcrR family transcriptional regulator